MFLDPTFYVAISFALFFLIMGRPIFRTILKMLDNRRSSIEKNINDATQTRKEAEGFLKQTQVHKKEIFKQIQDIQENSNREKESLIADAQKKLMDLTVREEKLVIEQIAQAENQALKNIKQEAIYLAVLATEKILEKDLDPTVNDQLIEQALTDIQRLDFQSIH